MQEGTRCNLGRQEHSEAPARLPGKVYAERQPVRYACWHKIRQEKGKKAVNTCTELGDFCSSLFIVIKDTVVFLNIRKHTVEINTKHSLLLGYKEGQTMIHVNSKCYSLYHGLHKVL